MLEPRILLEDPSKSFHAPFRVTAGDIFENFLVFGDNLLALKALESDFTSRVKCVFTDPPYNTGSAFQHCDDGLEHSLRLTPMGTEWTYGYVVVAGWNDQPPVIGPPVS
jgi:adenine-specific DNA-methyltransferase